MLPSEETKGDFFGPGFIANGVESPNSALRTLKGTQASSSDEVPSQEGHGRTSTGSSKLLKNYNSGIKPSKKVLRLLKSRQPHHAWSTLKSKKLMSEIRDLLIDSATKQTEHTLTGWDPGEEQSSIKDYEPDDNEESADKWNPGEEQSSIEDYEPDDDEESADEWDPREEQSSIEDYGSDDDEESADDGIPVRNNQVLKITDLTMMKNQPMNGITVRNNQV